MIRYLYGKKEYLLPIEQGIASPRFSDLSHYSRLENELMKDEETRKNFYWRKEEANISINGRTISNDSLTADPHVSIFPRHCFCLCLSSKKDSSELYERFDADYCLAINVNTLMTYLKKTFGNQIKQLVFMKSEITYYEKYEDLTSLTSEKAVFYKPNIFYPEAEYRIAIFYPIDKPGFNTPTGETIPFQSESESMHLQSFSKEGNTLWKGIVESSFESKSISRNVIDQR